nr:TspO/MBR family protein [uncultured Cohaesibacter sp.]
MTRGYWITLVIFLTISLGGGLFIGATNIPGPWYMELEKPPLTPPNWLFAPAWTLLYILIAIAGTRVVDLPGPRGPMMLWILQMGLNFAWSPIVFTLNHLVLGLVVILALIASIAAFIRVTWHRDRLAAMLFMPYALWVAFASYLNAGLVALN